MFFITLLLFIIGGMQTLLSGALAIGIITPFFPVAVFVTALLSAGAASM